MGWSGGGECGVREWFLMCFEWEIEWQNVGLWDVMCDVGFEGGWFEGVVVCGCDVCEECDEYCVAGRGSVLVCVLCC